MNETAKRILSSVIIVPIFLFCFYFSGWYYIQLYLFCLAAIIIGIKEFYSFSDRGDDGKPFSKLGLFYGFLIYTVFYLQFLQTQVHNPLPESAKTILMQLFNHNNDIILPIIMVMFIHIYVIQILTRQLDGAIFS
ncbi:MAG: phosphatidate cytidylyltransferase, partial [Leptospiraceae bacterium]|nr:phosphatidate cytidylyltransferase [Leptospiraceae bacterium]